MTAKPDNNSTFCVRCWNCLLLLSSTNKQSLSVFEDFIYNVNVIGSAN